jgi:hypothetical protein
MTNSLFNNIFKGQEIAFRAGQNQEKERIMNDLLRDSLVITQIDVRVLERIVEIIEDEA